MKEKLFYNFVNALIAIGIVSIPISVLCYILFETKMIRSDITHFNILVAGVLISLLSFTFHFILIRTSSYRRTAWKYRETYDNVYALAFSDQERDIDASFEKRIKAMGYNRTEIPLLRDCVYISEQIMKDGRAHVKAVQFINEDDTLKTAGGIKGYIKKLDAVMREYYSGIKLNVEAITGVVCVKVKDKGGKRADRYKKAKDFVYYNNDLVSQISVCAANTDTGSLYFNNDNLSGERHIPVKMITEIFGGQKK